MPRKEPMSSRDKQLLSRIIFLKSSMTVKEFALFVGITEKTVNNWRDGASRPTLDHIRTICKRTGVDKNWLLDGKTASRYALSHVVIPVCESVVKGRATIMDEARHLSCLATAEASVVDIDKIKFAVAALWSCATTAEQSDPMGHIRNSGESQPDEWTYIEECAKAHIPTRHLEIISERIDKAREAYIEPKIPDVFEREPAYTSTRVTECKNLPIIGSAAADNIAASRAELIAEPVEELNAIKEYHQLVRIIGDSMEPVVLDGQYVMIGAEIPSGADITGRGWIGVIQVRTENLRFTWPGGSDTSESGLATFCKRVHALGDGSLLLQSINTAICQPFTVARRDVVHLWPVHGVFFAGKGVPPTEAAAGKDHLMHEGLMEREELEPEDMPAQELEESGMADHESMV